jgi:acid phosphatase (class A)
MSRLIARVAVLAVLSAACSTALAQGKAPEAPLYLTDADLKIISELPSPPPEGSDAQKAELAELHRYQSSDHYRVVLATWDSEHESGEMFAPTFPPYFDLSKLPATAKLLADVRHEQKIAASRSKDFYKRLRPWAVDPTLKTCEQHNDDKPNSSYPSGHSSMGYAMAVVLADAWPAKSKAIMARAADYAESRLVCGVHWRSDVEAGRILGEALGRDLLAKPEFKAEEAAAAKELAALP